MKCKICKIFSFVGFGIIVLIAAMLVCSEKSEALFNFDDCYISYDENQKQIKDIDVSSSELFGDIKITSSVIALFDFDGGILIDNLEIENTNNNKDWMISSASLIDNTGGWLLYSNYWRVWSSDYGCLFDAYPGETFSSNMIIPAGKKLTFEISTTMDISQAIKYKNQIPLKLTYEISEIDAYVTFDGSALNFYYDNRYTEKSVTKWFIPEYDCSCSPDSQVDPGWIEYSKYVDRINIDLSFTNYKPTNCTKWFMGINTWQVDCSLINMQNVITASYMFSNLWSSNGISVVTGNISSIVFGDRFNTCNCICMNNMFDSYFGSQLCLPDSFFTYQVRNFSSFMEMDDSCFERASIVDVLFPLNFSFNSCTTSAKFFYNQKKLQRVSGWNCNFDNWNDFSYMFCNCYNLQIVSVCGPNLSWSGISDCVFANCRNLVGLNGYCWQESDTNSLEHTYIDSDFNESLFTFDKYAGISVNDDLAIREHVDYFDNQKYRICHGFDIFKCLTLGPNDGENFDCVVTDYCGMPNQEVILHKDRNSYLYFESFSNPGYVLSLNNRFPTLRDARLSWKRKDDFDNYYSNKWLFIKDNQFEGVSAFCSALTTEFHVSNISDILYPNLTNDPSFFGWQLIPCDSFAEIDSHAGNKENSVNKTTSMQENLDSFNVCELQKDSTLDMALSGLIVVGVGCLGGRRVIRHRLKIKEFWLCLNSKYK